MSTRTSSTGEEPTQPAAIPPVNSGRHGVADQLLATALGENCNNCGAGLAGDQRYCTECGHRRGGARFSLPSAPAPLGDEPRASRGPRFAVSPGSTLVAFVAVLLLALGVGVLIGHDTASTAKTASQPKISVNLGNSSGGSGTSAASTAGSTATGSKSSKGATGKGHSATSKAASKPLAKKVVAAATKAASSTLHAKTSLGSPTSQEGSSCTSGPGCQGGKQTNNLFP